MLDVDNSAPFLLREGLIDVESILDGELVISCVARRNRNLRVQGRGGQGYLLKQPGDPTEGGHVTLRTEAAFYAYCQSGPIAASMQDVLPRLAYFEPVQAILALELYAEAEPLWSYLIRNEPTQLPRDAHRSLGGALGTLHRVFRQPWPEDRAQLDWLVDLAPWVMYVHKPAPEMLATLSQANYQTLKILQSEAGLSARLDALRKRWRPSTVIHNDIKSDNILIQTSQNPGKAKARIVDWELVQKGDPAWDLAGALHDALLFWIQTMPLDPSKTADQMMAEARYPIASIQALCRALWAGYRETAELGDESAELLSRAVAFSAARLIQSAYEMAHGSQSLPSTSVILLQIAANILDDPELAQVRLYGLFGGAIL